MLRVRNFLRMRLLMPMTRASVKTSEISVEELCFYQAICFDWIPSCEDHQRCFNLWSDHNDNRTTLFLSNASSECKFVWKIADSNPTNFLPTLYRQESVVFFLNRNISPRPINCYSSKPTGRAWNRRWRSQTGDLEDSSPGTGMVNIIRPGLW